MKWRTLYETKLRSIEEILDLVTPNATIVVGMTPMEPKLLLQNLHRADKANNVTVFTCLNMGNYDFYLNPDHKGRFMNASWYFGASNREAIKKGLKTVSYVPNNLHQAGTNLIENRQIDLFVGVASPMDKNGFFYSLRLSGL